MLRTKSVVVLTRNEGTAQKERPEASVRIIE